MAGYDPKADLHRYLQAAREALLWKLEGLADYDVELLSIPVETLPGHEGAISYAAASSCAAWVS